MSIRRQRSRRPIVPTHPQDYRDVREESRTWRPTTEDKTPKWKRLLEKVTELAAPGKLKDTAHSYDLRTLYRFIAYCHVNRLRLGWVEFRGLLESGGTPKEEADRLARIYWHGRMILGYKRDQLWEPPGYLDDRP